MKDEIIERLVLLLIWGGGTLICERLFGTGLAYVIGAAIGVVLWSLVLKK